MDPNETLKLLLAHVREARERLDAQEEEWASNDHLLNSLVVQLESLDGWIAKGGFLPTRWGQKDLVEERTPEREGCDAFDREGCDEFTRILPGDCDGDGHYLCRVCKYKNEYT